VRTCTYVLVLGFLCLRSCTCALSRWFVVKSFVLSMCSQSEVMALTATHGDIIETPDQRFYGYLHAVPMLLVSWIAPL
jgi:hypothetical protein